MKQSTQIEAAKKEVEVIEEFFYNGVDTGIWDLKGDDVAPKSEGKKKKKKSSSKKKRAFVNPE